MPDPNRICDLHHNPWQYWILNPLGKARHWTCILMGTSQFVFAEPRLECHIFFILFLLFFFVFSRATPTAYGVSQARGLIGAVATSLHHSHSEAGSEPCSAAYTTAHSNAGPWIHWARPGSNLQPHGSSLDSLTTEPQWEHPVVFVNDKYSSDK